ncbi:MAG TPA: ROK family protein [Acidimicrobiales bacterium]|nr:ROK family protein [Acidimicrobiales bacterium]
MTRGDDPPRKRRFPAGPGAEGAEAISAVAVLGADDFPPFATTPADEPPEPFPAGGQPETPRRPYTLAIDAGGIGLKASVLDAEGRLVADRVRVSTPYPLPPRRFIATLAELVRPLPAYDRVSVGLPGVVRKGRVVASPPQYVTARGLGSEVDPQLVAAWKGFEIAEALAEQFGRPTRVANDADLQGLAVVTDTGLEFVVTFGTGVGTALFFDGVLAPHLELSNHPFRKGETYNDQLGEAALKRIGPERWRRRVMAALENFRVLTNFDHCYLGGGNSRHLRGVVNEPYSVVDNLAGIIGGVRLWDDTRMMGRD